MALAEQDRQPGWWDDYKDLVTPEALDRVSLEHSASRIITTETTFIMRSQNRNRRCRDDIELLEWLRTALEAAGARS